MTETLPAFCGKTTYLLIYGRIYHCQLSSAHSTYSFIQSFIFSRLLCGSLVWTWQNAMWTQATWLFVPSYHIGVRGVGGGGGQFAYRMRYRGRGVSIHKDEHWDPTIQSPETQSQRTVMQRCITNIPALHEKMSKVLSNLFAQCAMWYVFFFFFPGSVGEMNNREENASLGLV